MNPKETELFQEFSQLMEGFGIHIVDLSYADTKGGSHLVLIIYKPQGIGHLELEQIHRTVKARLEVLEPYGYDGSIEISTPGIERKIKNPWEFDLFVDRGIRILEENESEWFRGLLSDVSEDSITISNAMEKRTFPRNRIRKAKLDPQQDRR